MSTAEIIFAALAALSPIVSVIIALVVARRNKDKDVKSEGKDQGALQSDVGYIKSTSDRIEKRLDTFDQKQDNMNQRLITIETRFEDHVRDQNIHHHPSSRKKAQPAK